MSPVAVIDADAPGTAMPSHTLGGAASVFLRDLLTGPDRTGRVSGVTRKAVYVRLDDIDDTRSAHRHPRRDPGHVTVVAIELPGGVQLPNAVTVGSDAAPALAALEVGQSVAVGGRAVSWSLPSARRGPASQDHAPRPVSARVCVRRWWDPRAGGSRLDLDDLRGALAAIDGRVAADSRAFGLEPAVAVLRHELHRRPAPDHHPLAMACRDLVGRGPGLTPAGDDVLAGVSALLRHVASGRDVPTAVRAACGALADRLARVVLEPAVLRRTNDVSADLLRCADRGGVTAAARTVFRAIGTPDLPVATRRLAAIGHTSGRDLLVGIGLALDVVAARWDDPHPDDPYVHDHVRGRGIPAVPPTTPTTRT